MRFIKSKRVKDFFTLVLSVLVIVLVFVGGSSLLKNVINKDDYSKINLTWEIGGLTTTGKYSETKKSIYTKKSFACDGLITQLDFDSNIKYQVFFYDEKDVFISSTSVLSESVEHDLPEHAALARIVITPIWAEDVKKDEQIIKWYDLITNIYAKQLKVKVLNVVDEEKKENVDSEDLAFAYQVGDEPDYVNFNLETYDFNYLNVAVNKDKDLFDHAIFSNPNDAKNMFVLGFIFRGSNLFDFGLYTSLSPLTEVVSFFRYNAVDGSFTNVNEDYVSISEDSILISYDFTTLLKIGSYEQGNFYKYI